MSVDIHKTAIVSDKAQIGSNVKIGPYSIIEDDVRIGNNTIIKAHVLLANGARIGNDCLLYQGAVISEFPQDIKFDGRPTEVFVGDRTVIREYVTIHRATKNEGKTILGSDCLIMAYCHMAHDCNVGSNVIMANATNLGGHVIVEDWVILGGVVKIHQFCRVGCHTMVGADCKIVKDVPPYTLIGREPCKIEGLNKIGLKRRGFSNEVINEIENFYHILLRSGYNVSDGIKKYKESNIIIPEVQHCIEFTEESKRGIYI